MPLSDLDSAAFVDLLRDQAGLFTAAQARRVGLTGSALSRRLARGDEWQRVLPRVYAAFAHPLTDRDLVRALVLYAGPGACLTGAAALHWAGVQHLPRQLRAWPADILVPQDRRLTPQPGLRAHRTQRLPPGTRVDRLLLAPPSRAVVDAARRLSSAETALGLLTCVINGRVSTAELVAVELAAGPVRGSRALRLALAEVLTGTRSMSEAEARRLFASAGLPTPEINVAITVGSEILVPDFRWGKLIVEIDSEEFHLLEPGSWQRTLRRWARLSAAGYIVLPVSPAQVRDDPHGVLAAIRESLALLAAS